MMKQIDVHHRAGVQTSVNAFPDGGRRALHDLQAGTVVVGTY
jgi:hypothetical protein